MSMDSACSHGAVSTVTHAVLSVKEQQPLNNPIDVLSALIHAVISVVGTGTAEYVCISCFQDYAGLHPSMPAHQNPKFYRSERSVLNPNQSEAVRSSEYNEATEDLDAHSIYVPEYISFQDSQNLLST